MRSSTLSESAQFSALEAIDARLSEGGLTRSPRRKAAVSPRERYRRANAEDLSPAVPVPHVASNGVHWLPVPGWNLPWLWAGFSTRLGGTSRAYCADDAPGELNLGFTADDPRETVEANRRLLAEAVTGDAATPIAALRQFHSNLIVQASVADAIHGKSSSLGWKAGVPGGGSMPLGCKAGVPGGGSMPLGWKADGQITAEPGSLLAIQTADCIPVLVADRKLRVVAGFHAGWRGTVRRIVENGVGRMRLEYGSRPEDLIAAIGPGIGACCYAIGEEVLSEFTSQFTYADELLHEVYDSNVVHTRYPLLFLTQRAPGHSDIGPSLHLDLIEANRRQLLSAGLKPRAIKVVGCCTNCHPELFFSHRASHGRTGRMMAVIGIRKAR